MPDKPPPNDAGRYAYVATRGKIEKIREDEFPDGSFDPSEIPTRPEHISHERIARVAHRVVLRKRQPTARVVVSIVLIVGAAIVVLRWLLLR